MGMRRGIKYVAALGAAIMLIYGNQALTSEAQEKPRIAALCKQCHVPDDKILRGTFTSVSKAKDFGTIQMQIGPATWIVKWDDKTELIGEEKYSKIPKEKEIAITIEGTGDDIYAEKVSIKPPAQVPEEKLIRTDAVAKLVDQGEVKSTFLLVDSRPGPRYHEGHIPGAIFIYDADFEKNIDKLPKDKDILLIFYCGGTT